MYTKVIPHKNFKNQPRNYEVQFNLTVPEIMKLMNEFSVIFRWKDSLNAETDSRPLQTSEVVDFYNAFETVLLAAYGVMDDDGDHFRKAGRFDFEESALFASAMTMYVTDPPECFKLLEGIMPEGMEDMIKKSEGNLEKMEQDPETPEAMRLEIARLRAERESSSNSS